MAGQTRTRHGGQASAAHVNKFAQCQHPKTASQRSMSLSPGATKDGGRSEADLPYDLMSKKEADETLDQVKGRHRICRARERAVAVRRRW